jgi:FkbM family methyltransferase
LKNVLGEEIFSTQEEKETFYNNLYNNGFFVDPKLDKRAIKGKDDIVRERLIPLCKEAEIKSIVDIGSADAKYCVWLYEALGIEVDAIEITEERTDKLVRLMAAFGYPIDAYRLDVELEPLPRNYDLIFASDLIEHLDDYKRTWESFLDHCRIIYTLIPAYDSWNWSPDHLHRFDDTKITELIDMSNGLAFLERPYYDQTNYWYALAVHGRLTDKGQYKKRFILADGTSKIMKEIELKDSSKIMVRDDDNGISSELQNGGTHEEGCTNFLKTVVKPGWKVYDIGANLGYFGIMELALVGREGFVYALEPVTENIACLKVNIERYNYTNISPFEVALGFDNMLVPMRLTSMSNSGTMLLEENSSDWYKTWFDGWHINDIVVEQWCLDDFIKVKKLPIPDMVRMDVEGYEVDIISGAQKTLKKMASGSMLFLEIHSKCFKTPVETTRALLETLYSYRFLPVWCLRWGEEGLTDFPKSLDVFNSYITSHENVSYVFFVKEKL